MAGCRKVHFSGGEVFLRADFLDLVEHAVGLGLKTNITTNGTLIDKARARRLIRSGVNSISVSLDDPTARVHDAIRGQQGSHRRTVRAIRWLVRYGAAEQRQSRGKVRINFVVMRDNFRRLPRMVELAGELGAVDLAAMPVDEKGGNNRLSRRQIERFNLEVVPQALELRRRYGFPTAPDRVYPFGVTPLDIRYTKHGLYARGQYERMLCMVPWLHMFIAWDGQVSLCCMTNGRAPPLGNLAAQSVREVFDGPRYREVRAAFRSGHQPTDCARCDLFLRENRQLAAALAAL
jgi:MoaA/NifB/PqqE/SkfB family radical SAM enzyme